MSRFALPTRFEGCEKNVWVEYIQLAAKYKPLNLGQGFPDFAAPLHVTKALSNAALDSSVLLNQYTRSFGHPRLVNALAALYSKVTGRDINPETDILVTAGAYEALLTAIQGNLEPGDEAIIIEPFYDCYAPMVSSVGGVPIFTQLRPPDKKTDFISSDDWVLNEKELESCFTPKTKLLIFNTPHNPSGKVFSQKEMQVIADLCQKHDVVCISDEVYEWMVYTPRKHVRIATLAGMWDRTITIGSAGKTFSVTGWKTGWAYGPSHLMHNLHVVFQTWAYTHCTPVQEAISRCLEFELTRFDSPDCYLRSLAEELKAKRDRMVRMLQEAGMVPTVPDGGCFVIADWTALEGKANLDDEIDENKDYRFTKWMTKNIGLQGIPPSAFYSKKNQRMGEDLIRFCFIKSDETLEKAENILRKWTHE